MICLYKVLSSNRKIVIYCDPLNTGSEKMGYKTICIISSHFGQKYTQSLKSGL